MRHEQEVAPCQLRQWADTSSVVRRGGLFIVLKRMRDEEEYYRPNWWVLEGERQLIFSEDYILRHSEEQPIGGDHAGR